MKNAKGVNYFETKQKLLPAYLQAISFYLLLKSEGHPVRDHPVIAHLVELKNMREKVKNMDVTVSPLVGAISYNDRTKEEKDGPDLDSDIFADHAKSLEVMDDDADEEADTKVEPGEGEPEDDFYKDFIDALSVETEADGKRQITYQMEKNKGLTRYRKKLTKIPRKKYKLKHAKAIVCRKGQVRDIRKPVGPYGGEASGINTRVSRNIRL